MDAAMSLGPDWRAFQEDVATVFVMAGLAVAVDAALAGVRARHDVDVLVRLGGEDNTDRFWVVECKLWGRPVPKSEVLTLRSVVEDVGAERGFLVSASGFQPAAISAASNTNLTLCDIDQLRAELRTRRIAHELVDVENRVNHLAVQLNALHGRTIWPPSQSYGELLTRLNYKQWAHWRTSLDVTRAGLSDARMGRWPSAASLAPPRHELSNGEKLMTADVDEFLVVASQRLDDAARWTSTAERWLALSWENEMRWSREERNDVRDLADLLLGPFRIAIHHAEAPKQRSGPTFMEQELVSRLRDQRIEALGYLPRIDIDGLPIHLIGNRDDLFLCDINGQAVGMIGASWGGTEREPTCFAYRLILVDAVEPVEEDLDRGLRSLGRLTTLAMFVDSDGVERAARMNFDSGTCVNVWLTHNGYVRHSVGPFPAALGALTPGRAL